MILSYDCNLCAIPQHHSAGIAGLISCRLSILSLANRTFPTFLMQY